MAQLPRLAAHRLNARKRNRLAQITLSNAGRINPHRRTRPVLAHLLGVLLDKLLDMGEHQDTGLGPVLQSILAQRGHNMALARARRQHQAGVALVASLKPGIELVNGALLVFPQHGSFPHWSAIACAMPANVSLRSFQRSALGGILWMRCSRPSTMSVGLSNGRFLSHRLVAFVSP